MARKMVNDEFAKVHLLLKRGSLSAALRLLLKPGSKTINEAFRSDLNHAWYCVGDILFRKKEFDAAKHAFKRSVLYRPEDEDALEAIGNCYDEQKRPKLAERYFRRALAVAHTMKSADRAAITFNLANSIFDQGRLDEAIEIYRQLTKAHFSIRKSAQKNLKLAELRAQAGTGKRTRAEA